MLGRSLLTAATALLLASPAVANDCASDVRQIDQVLSEEPQLPTEELLRIEQLRNQGAELCSAGRIVQASILLEEAKARLGMI